MSKSDWQRVSKRRPCPVCGKPDWCLVAGPMDAPAAAICARVESRKRCGEGGWLHVLRDDGPVWTPWRRTIGRAIRMMGQPGNGMADFGKLAADFREALRPEALGGLAHSLGVSVGSLSRLGIGWSTRHRAWSFPMGGAHGQVVGIRLRLPNGRKLSVKGGKEGLFLPEGLDLGGRLLLCEGPTDCAALLDLGFPAAVGRPSCTGGARHVVDLVRRLSVPEVVIMADNDAPGQRGADSLAAVLVAYCPAVRVMTPPAGIKDARAWKQRGATAADVQAAIDAAPVRRLGIRTKRKAGIGHGR